LSFDPEVLSLWSSREYFTRLIVKETTIVSAKDDETRELDGKDNGKKEFSVRSFVLSSMTDVTR
jgi:hypothetical protein